MGNRVAHVARVVLLGLLIAALLAPAALAASVSAVINAQTKVYEYPTKAARAIHVPQYLGVKLTGVSHGWARVSYKGNTAYLPAKYVTLKKPIKAYTVRRRRRTGTWAAAAWARCPQAPRCMWSASTAASHWCRIRPARCAAM